MKRILIMTLLMGSYGIFMANLCAAQSNDVQQGPVIEQLFASPDDAVKALQVATQTKDKAALSEIFGPQVKELLTGDEVQDAKNAQKLATVMSQGYTLVKEGDDKITIEVGTNSWPMPIPLVKANGQWYFDTAAGKEEIINRHIGKDELHAIGVCRYYVTAQQQYASVNPDANQGVRYAQRFMSSTGKRDGLYWPSGENEMASPFGTLVAEEANTEGYSINKGLSLQPFHGYYFRILTRQGIAAPGGKMNYMSHGYLTKGFALVAYPVNWDHSGIMTFIVNKDGKVYQRNYGDKTSRIAKAMKVYNPNNEWTLVEDEGVSVSVK